MKMLFNCKRSQAGFSAISIMLILMILGLILLTGFHQLVNRWQKIIITEQSYYLRFNQANSALNWATTRNWQIATTRWQCQNENHHQFTACIKKSLLKTDDYVLVRGEYHQFYLYYLAHQHDEKLQFEKGHWLDYCPEKNRLNCE